MVTVHSDNKETLLLLLDRLFLPISIKSSFKNETDTLCDKSLCCWDQSNPWDWYTVWQVTVLLRPVKPMRLIWDGYTVWQVTVLLRPVKPMRLIHCVTSHCVVETKPMRLIHCVTSHCVVETSQTHETDTLCDKSLCCWDQSNPWDWYTVWQVTVLLRPVKPMRLIHCNKSLCCWDLSNPWDWYTVTSQCVVETSQTHETDTLCDKSLCCWDQSNPWDWYTVWQVTVLLRPVKPMRLIHCVTSHCVVETSQTHETDTLCDKSLCCWDQTHETDTLCDKSLCCWDQSNPWDGYTVWQVTVLLRPVKPMRLIHCVTSHCVVETSQTHETDTLCDKSLWSWYQSNPWDWYEMDTLCDKSLCCWDQTHETDTLCDKSLCCWDKSNSRDWYTVWQVTVLLRLVKPMRLIHCVTSHCVVETSQTNETDTLCDKSLCCWD